MMWMLDVQHQILYRQIQLICLHDLVTQTWPEISVEFLVLGMWWLGLRKAFLALRPCTLFWFCLGQRHTFVEAFRTSDKSTFQFCALSEMR